MAGLIIWCVFIVIGCLVGQSRGQALAGLFLSLLLGPLGVLITVCLPDLVKKRADAVRKLQIDEQIRLQQAQLDSLLQLQQGSASIPSTLGKPQTFRIAAKGQDLGDIPSASVVLMLKGGQLSPSDYFLDLTTNQWEPLSCLPIL